MEHVYRSIQTYSKTNGTDRNKPIIEHIMGIYAHYGHKEFYIALGYKGEIIKDYFKNFKKDWKINLIETGADTYTGGRLKRLEKYLSKETFYSLMEMVCLILILIS